MYFLIQTYEDFKLSFYYWIKAYKLWPENMLYFLKFVDTYLKAQSS